jgi:transcriptional regulator with XRE-family HTH domain
MSTHSKHGRQLATTETDQFVTALGARIRDGRLKLGLSGRRLAARVGVTSAFISQIERGLATPSLATLMRIVEATGISVGDLFDVSPRSQGQVLERDDWQPYEHPPLQNVVLANDADGRLQAVWTLFPPHTTLPNLVIPAAVLSFVFVLTGTVEYRDGDTVCVLKPYSSSVLDGSRSRTWSNPYDEPAEVLVVAAQPSARS